MTGCMVAAAHAEKALFTQLSLDTREVFLHYQHNSDAVSDVTFNVKDFRHMLSMCESLGASVAIRFDQPGAPLLVEPQFRGTYVGCALGRQPSHKSQRTLNTSRHQCHQEKPEQ